MHINLKAMSKKQQHKLTSLCARTNNLRRKLQLKSNKSGSLTELHHNCYFTSFITSTALLLSKRLNYQP